AISYKIGDGRSIRVWDSPWLQSIAGSQPIGPLAGDRERVEFVSDLFKHDRYEWDVELGEVGIRQVGQILISASASDIDENLMSVIGRAVRDGKVIKEWRDTRERVTDGQQRDLHLTKWLLEASMTEGWDRIECKVAMQETVELLQRRDEGNPSWTEEAAAIVVVLWQ
ncbi:conserved oligomeric Golgi complex subunit 4, partial [Striga asiatica]